VAKKVRIIRPPDDLRRRAVNTTRGLNLDLTPAEISRIETAVHRSKDRFVSQVAEKLKALRALHQEAETKPELRPAYLAELRDETLAIKGLGGMFGYSLVTSIAGNLNDFVLKRQTVDAPQLTVIRLHIDSIYVILARKAEALKPELEGELVASFRLLTAKHA
jgi:hypothetical protein